MAQNDSSNHLDHHILGSKQLSQHYGLILISSQDLWMLETWRHDLWRDVEHGGFKCTVSHLHTTVVITSNTSKRRGIILIIKVFHSKLPELHFKSYFALLHQQLYHVLHSLLSWDPLLLLNLHESGPCRSQCSTVAEPSDIYGCAERLHMPSMNSMSSKLLNITMQNKPNCQNKR